MKVAAIHICVASAILGLFLEFLYYSSDLVYTSRYFFFVILMFLAVPTLFAIFFRPEKKFYIYFLTILLPDK